MSAAQERLARFAKAAAAGPFEVRVHAPKPETGAAQRLATQAVVALGLLAAAAAAHYAKPEPHRNPVAQGRVSEPLDDIRSQLRWVPVQINGQPGQTLDLGSRILLVKEAARTERLAEVGLDHRDLYGLIHAETSWVARAGKSKDGTPNLGIAQFEPATAAAVGLSNPDDPVESVHAAARLMKDAARWSKARVRALDPNARREPVPQQQKVVREGVSVYYNLSVRGRERWNGSNLNSLPVETQQHVANAEEGRQLAASIERRLARAGTEMLVAGRLQGPQEAKSWAGTPAAPQLSGHRTATALRGVLTSPCEFRADAITPVTYNLTCASRYPRVMPQIPVGNVYNDMTLMGQFRGMPVFLIDDEEVNAMSFTYIDTSGKHLPAMVLTTSLVDRLSSAGEENARLALMFVLAHEEGHLLCEHRLPDFDAAGLIQIAQNEADADYRALQYLTSETDVGTARRVVDHVFKVFDETAEQLPQAVAAITRKRQADLHQWMDTMVEVAEESAAESRRDRQAFANAP